MSHMRVLYVLKLKILQRNKLNDVTSIRVVFQIFIFISEIGNKMYRGDVSHCDLVNPGPISWSKILPLALLGSPNVWGKVFIQMLFYFGGWISMQEIETTNQVFMHKNNPWLGLLGVLVSPCFPSFFLHCLIWH